MQMSNLREDLVLCGIDSPAITEHVRESPRYRAFGNFSLNSLSPRLRTGIARAILDFY